MLRASKQVDEEMFEYQGVTYKSEREMCRKKGLVVSTYYRARHKGASVKEAIKKAKKKEYKFRGTSYKSIRAAAAAANIPDYVVYNRLSNGEALSEALSAPKTKPHKGAAKPITINGVEYETQGEALSDNNITLCAFYKALKICKGDREDAILYCMQNH